jgi:four helix bundle protein
MKKNVVRQKSFDFALRIIEIYKNLCNEKKEFVLSRQVLRSGTSIGANIVEADSSISRAEFSAKISIAYKEARETCYWLRLLFHGSYLDYKTFNSMVADSDELCKLLYSILKSSGRIRENV